MLLTRHVWQPGQATVAAYSRSRRVVRITRVKESSRNGSFVDRCGLAPPIDLMRPARERAAESGCVA